MSWCFSDFVRNPIVTLGYVRDLLYGSVRYVSFNEMADAVESCIAAAPNVLWLADGDTGHGNALAVQKVIRAYARRGAAAVLIEDKVWPRPLGREGAKLVVDREHAILRCRAAVEACRDEGILLLARTVPGSTGNAGAVSVAAGVISVVNGGAISSATAGPGNGGVVQVSTQEIATLPQGSHIGTASMCNQHQCGAPIILILRWPDSEPLATASNLGGETCLVAVTQDILGDRGNLPVRGPLPARQTSPARG